MQGVLSAGVRARAEIDTPRAAHYFPRPRHKSNGNAVPYLRRLSVKFAPRILIVDESADSREVLSMLLARHGATTIEARRPNQAIALADQEPVDLIVFDAESDRSDSGSGTDDLKAAASRNGTPIVILGTVRNRKKRPEEGQFLAKPYHYGQLINKIENLLDAA